MIQKGLMRILVSVPDVYGDAVTQWASPCLPPGVRLSSSDWHPGLDRV